MLEGKARKEVGGQGVSPSSFGQRVRWMTQAMLFLEIARRRTRGMEGGKRILFSQHMSREYFSPGSIRGAVFAARPNFSLGIFRRRSRNVSAAYHICNVMWRGLCLIGHGAIFLGCFRSHPNFFVSTGSGGEGGQVPKRSDSQSCYR